MPFALQKEETDQFFPRFLIEKEEIVVTHRQYMYLVILSVMLHSQPQVPFIKPVIHMHLLGRT
jgi:hypothetical protein